MAAILLIEDNAELLAQIHVALESDGHAVRAAADGNAGLELLTQQSFDLVITDILMPGLDGIEVLKAIRRDRPRLPVIMMSGGGRLIGREEALHLSRPLGATATLDKPFKRETLLALVARTLAASADDPDEAASD